MKKLISLFSISMICFAGQQSAAIFDPGAEPKPHTLCFEETLRKPGVQVLLTNVEDEAQKMAVRVDFYEMSSRGSQMIASQSVTPAKTDASVKYLGNNFSLTVENEVRPSEELRTGELVIVLDDGQKIIKTMKCDGIMHVLGAI